MVHSAVGAVTTVEGKTYITTARGQAGFALYGPYDRMPPGDYSVVFEMEIPERSQQGARPNSICAYIDVTGEAGTRVLARRPLFARALTTRGAQHRLDFSLGDAMSLEFRVYSTGASDLLIAADRIISIHRQTRFSPILNDDGPRTPFFEKHFDQFCDLFNKGAEVQPSKSGTLVSFLGIKLNVTNYDDFQMIQEILVGNVYRFSPKRDVCVLDVGMNAGIAALHFATLARVKKVYGFEPFRAIHDRAVAHFQLNPTLADKIQAMDFGLGLQNERRVVLHDAEHSIDVSIKGASKGHPTQINIRDAAEVLLELVAKHSDLDIVLKLDCEGSEFPILDALDRANVAGIPAIYMIEWHKAWSPGRNQDYLIEKLNRNGFTVFDQTNPFDPYAGLLYAAR